MHPEHDRADLAPADTALAIEGHRQRLPRVGQGRDVRQQHRRVEVHGVAAYRLDARYSGIHQRLSEIRRRADPVAQVVLLDHLLETLRDGFEVATSEAAIGGKTLRQDQQVPTALRPGVIVHRQPAANIGDGVLLGAHRHPIRQRCHLAHDLADLHVGIPSLALLDEPRVLRKTARVQEERKPVSVTHLAHGAQVLEAHWLTATGVVGDRDHDERDVLRAAFTDAGIEGGDVHVALEGMQDRWVVALLDHQVDGLRAGELDVGSRRVEMCVVRHHLAWTADDAEQDLLRCAPLVGGDHVLEREERLHALQEPVPGRRSRVALVAALDARPLRGRHRAGARIGQQVDEHVIRVEVEQVVAGRLELLLPLRDGRQPDRLDALDAERFDDRLPALHAGESIGVARSATVPQRHIEPR